MNTVKNIKSNELKVAKFLGFFGSYSPLKCITVNEDRYFETTTGWIIDVVSSSQINKTDLIRRWHKATKAANVMRIADKENPFPNMPAVFYRRKPNEWRAIWPLFLNYSQQHGSTFTSFNDTVEGSVIGWDRIMRYNHVDLVIPESRELRERLTNLCFHTATQEDLEEMDEIFGIDQIDEIDKIYDTDKTCIKQSV